VPPEKHGFTLSALYTKSPHNDNVEVIHQKKTKKCQMQTSVQNCK